MIINNISKFLNEKGFSVSFAEKKIGISNGSLSKPIKDNKTIKTDTLEKFLISFPEINPNWLLTGEGKMLKEIKPYVPSSLTGRSDTDLDTIMKTIDNSFSKMPKEAKGIPLIPLAAMAGFGVGESQVMPYNTHDYIIPEFEELNVEFMIRVKGSSMYPKYNSGDIVACKKIPLDTFFQWNKVYVLDTIQGAMIKRICESKEENSILCVSDNEKYTPFDLHKSEIHSLAIVLGVIRLE